MKVLTRDKCAECDGAGLLQSKIWTEFFEIEKQSNRAWEMEEVENWFIERGYYKLPPEEPVCYECDGTGEIEWWIDVKELIKILTPNS